MADSMDTATEGSPPPRPEIHLNVHSATQELEALVFNDPNRSPLLRRRGLATMPARRPPYAPPSYPPPPTPPSSVMGPRTSFQFARPSPPAGPGMLILNDSAISLSSSPLSSPVDRVSSSPNLTLLSSGQPQTVYARRSRSSQDLREYSPSTSLEMNRESSSSGCDPFLDVPVQGNDTPGRSSDEISINSSRSSAVDMQVYLPHAGFIGYMSSPDVPESLLRATSEDDDTSEIDGKHGQYVANVTGTRSLESLRSTGRTQDNWHAANVEATPRFARAALGAERHVLPLSTRHYRKASGRSVSRCSSRLSISSRLAHRPSLAFAATRVTPTLEEEAKPASSSPTESWYTSTTSSIHSAPSFERVSTATSRTSSESIIGYPTQTVMDDSTHLLAPRASRDSLRRCISASDDSRPLSVVAEDDKELDDSCTIQTAAVTLTDQPTLSSRFLPLRNFAGRVRSRTLSIGAKHSANMSLYGDSKSRASKDSLATTLASTGGIDHNPDLPSSPGWGLVSLRSVNRKRRRPSTATSLARLHAATQTPVPPLPPLPPNPFISSQEITSEVNSNPFPRSSVSSWRRPSTSPTGHTRNSFLSFGSLGGRPSTDCAPEAYSTLPSILTVNTQTSQVLGSEVTDEAWPDSPTITPWSNGTNVSGSETVGSVQKEDENVMNMTGGTMSVDELGVPVTVRRSDQKSTRSLRSNSTAGTKMKKEGTVRRLWRNLTLGGTKKPL